ncbi:hypothetical protein GJ744_002731 [Endocarpon pusillum]|uniref:Phosphoribulokinase/uridine kinase domain-containing protein n=1 Tax=Endocarpon pusillum TaxID=364733 RepID=A0A8H7AMS6_9EURO|nr:hypothetical protein GJ744_002731 [Endocarpon pusillum]
MTTHQCITKTLIVGLSGPSSSGKTTVARLLRSIFNIPASAETNHHSVTLFILHQDDFYKTDAEIPIVTTPLTQRQLQDWDSAAALDLGLLERSLRFVATHGQLPPWGLASKEPEEDGNAGGAGGAGGASGSVSDADIERYRRQVVATVLNPTPLPASSSSFPPAGKSPRQAAALGGGGVEMRICVLDGFLLYADPGAQNNPSIPASITELLDLKLFLRSTEARTRARREARSGYVTLEGFWRDPDGYVDEVVWPNYVREHAWIFEGGDVDQGAVRAEVRERCGIEVAPGMGERAVRVVGYGWAVGRRVAGA